MGTFEWKKCEHAETRTTETSDHSSVLKCLIDFVPNQSNFYEVPICFILLETQEWIVTRFGK